MPAVASAEVPELILTSHEERLQSLEEGIKGMTSKLEVTATNTAHVAEGLEGLAERFEKAIGSVGDRISETFERLERKQQEGEAAQASLAKVVEELQSHQKRSHERREFFKKLAWGVSLPIAGIVAKDGGLALLTFITHSLQHK